MSFYSPETGAIREAYLLWCFETDEEFDGPRSSAEFDRWFASEIESAEARGYFKSVQDAYYNRLGYEEEP